MRAAAAAGARSFRLWSAAASNGAEACTILIVLEQVLGRGFGGRTVELLGTDVNEQVLAAARSACFRPYALAQTPPDVVRTWFRPVAGDRFEFDRRLLQCATFRQHNLLAPMTAPAFDFVFLHNVLLYFDAASKERALGHVHRALRPGGMLTVGESEHLLGVAHRFTYVRPSWFQKPAVASCGAAGAE